MDYMKLFLYLSVVGSVMYVMIGIRLDYFYLVGVISRYMSKLLRSYW